MTDAEKAEMLRLMLETVLKAEVGPEDEPVGDMIDITISREAYDVLEKTK